MTEPLSERTRRLLDAERAALTPDAASRAAIHRGARAALGFDPSGGGPGESPPDGGAIGGSAPSTGVSALQAVLTTKAGAALIGAVFLGGAAVGAGSYATIVERPVPTPIETVVVREEAPVVAPAPPEVPPPPPMPVEVPVAPTTDPPRRVVQRPPQVEQVPVGATDLVAERVLLERAEVALRRARPADARSALDEHAERFPRGILAAERDGLAVLALLASGDRTGGERAAALYLEQHPNGVLSTRVRRALEAP